MQEIKNIYDVKVGDLVVPLERCYAAGEVIICDYEMGIFTVRLLGKYTGYDVDIVEIDIFQENRIFRM